MVTPGQAAAGYHGPEIDLAETSTQGSGTVIVEVADHESVKPNHTYKIKFQVDTLGYARKNKALRHESDYIRVNNGLKVYDVTENNRLVYEESPSGFPLDNIKADGETRVSDNFKTVGYNYYRNDKEILTDIFDGVQIGLSDLALLGEIDEEKSGWVTGESLINITQSAYESHGFPNTYDIIFTDNNTEHTPKITRPSYIFNLLGSTGEVIGPSFVLTDYLLGRSFPFYVVDQTLTDSSGSFERLEIIVEDVNHNGTVDMLEDRFLVGHTIDRIGHVYWCGTIFGFGFHGLSDESELPKAEDVYRVQFRRPFAESDSLLFTTIPPKELIEEQIDITMDDIKVVPNPYIMTNSMEPAVGNKFLNQRRRLMFTHIPAQCEIRIFTSSGVLVDKIDVDNEPSNGTVHWDLLSREDLEVAAGMYVYHVKAKETGKEKLGKFAVIK